MKIGRDLKLVKDYTPFPIGEGDEIYPNGIFHFNISKIQEHIKNGTLTVEEESVSVSEWFTCHFRGSVNEDHLPAVDVSKTIIQAEIRPGHFEIIDGNHRLEKAYRQGMKYVNSFKLQGEQLVPYFISENGYTAFVDYWNRKLIKRN